MALTVVVAGQVISASVANANWSNAVSIDTARTVSVTHTWTATQTFTGGWTAGAACTISTGGLTVTAGGLTVTAGVFAAAAGGTHGFGTGLTTENTTTTLVVRCGTNAGANDKHGEVAFYRGATQLWQMGLLGTSSTDTSMRWYANGAVRMVLTDAGVLSLSSSLGAAKLLADQGANDDEILTLRSSDVAHGMTTLTDTTTFGAMIKASANAGGLQINGYSEGTGGIHFYSYNTGESTDKTTGAGGSLTFNSLLKSGTSAGAMSANANLAVFQTNGTTRFILDADGDSHQDVGTAWTNFDTHDDVALLNLLAAKVSRRNDPLRRSFGKFLRQNRKELERVGLVRFNRNGHHFVNMSRLTMLHTGALRQIGGQMAEMRRAVKLALEGDRAGALALVGA